MATSEMDRDQAQATARIRRAHDVIDGCILSLAISDSAKRSLQRELEALYEAAIYPIVQSADENRTSKPTAGGGTVSTADSPVSSERENSW